MEREEFISGYCRCTDNSRMVCVEIEDDRITEVDCNFGSCPYEKDCSVAEKLRALGSNTSV